MHEPDTRIAMVVDCASSGALAACLSAHPDATGWSYYEGIQRAMRCEDQLSSRCRRGLVIESPPLPDVLVMGELWLDPLDEDVYADWWRACNLGRRLWLVSLPLELWFVGVTTASGQPFGSMADAQAALDEYHTGIRLVEDNSDGTYNASLSADLRRRLRTDGWVYMTRTNLRVEIETH